MKKMRNPRWKFLAYDLLIFLAAAGLPALTSRKLAPPDILLPMAAACVCIFSARLVGGVYRQVWCCGGSQCYIRLAAADAVGFLLTSVLEFLLWQASAPFLMSAVISGMNLLAALLLRIFYRYACRRVQLVGGTHSPQEFDLEALLFRKPVVVNDARTVRYYRDKVILITGCGTIGSELCRQLAKMHPKQLVLLDVYENGVYDVQQELRIAYADTLDVQIEILSITNQSALEKVFATYHPQIVIHAAAHKHVPLMEHNCVEAVQNNVFGTKNVIDACEKYGAERLMMISTDKAVNPTNVMGATKRMCEMLMQSASIHGQVKYSATRFGNVLGSAGSVIPLFQRQIANGGPVTITDKRITRYFMTIPEASQLVLASGAMAQNGELFVLDMGRPVRILDLAENMIRLSGVPGIEIVETGLRPGEKLYEELLIQTESLDKTDNRLIFIERDTPLPGEEMEKRLELLRRACQTQDDQIVRAALHQAVPTFRAPEEVNRTAAASK